MENISYLANLFRILNNIYYFYAIYIYSSILLFLAIGLIIVLLGICSWTLNKTVKSKTKELVESNNKIQTIVNAVPDMILIINNEGIIINLYNNCVKNYILLTEIAIGKSLSNILRCKCEKPFEEYFEKAMNTEETVSYECKISDNNSDCYFEIRLKRCGETNNVMAIIRNITERKITEESMYKMSMYDITTGLYNRNYFESKINKYKKEEIIGMGIVVCDIDGLKLINDTLGHIKGDEYLILVAHILDKHFETKDFIARIGGDEFAIMIKNATVEKFEKIKEAINNEICQANNKINIMPISVSFGFEIHTSSKLDLYYTFKKADNYMYREKLHHRQSMKSKNIKILTKMLKARDFITEGHGERLSLLAYKLAKVIGMSETDIKDVHLLAQFHDIGKVGISDSILFKPAKLSPDEMFEMKRHSYIGCCIASSSPDLAHISDWILKHHEYWNGEGYPIGLEGDKIPIQCRILAITDAYDAMTNDRPYRKAMSKAQAIEELRRCANEQFDPYLVEEFIKII